MKHCKNGHAMTGANVGYVTHTSGPHAGKREPTNWAREVLKLDAEGAYPSEHGGRLAKDALGVA